MKPGIGTLRVIPSIWGRKYHDSFVSEFVLIDIITDWAGGPGNSKADVKWIDERLREFLEANELGSSVEEMVQAGKGLKI